MSAELRQTTIRRADINDAAVLAELGAVTFTRSYASIIPAEELAAYAGEAFSVDRVRSELANPDVVYLKALASEDVCGYAKLERTTPPLRITAPDPIELVRLYAAPGWIARGVGTTLLRAILKAAVAAGCGACWLRVWQGNDLAVGFYRRWGFAEVGSEPYLVGRACETVLLMIRQLTNPAK